MTREDEKQYKGENSIRSKLHLSHNSLLSGRCGHLTKLQNKRVTTLIEWKTPSYQWRGGSKWVGEGRVLTVQMWNKCSSFAVATFTKCFCFFFLFINRRKTGLKHTIMCAPKSLKTGQTVFSSIFSATETWFFWFFSFFAPMLI